MKRAVARRQLLFFSTSLAAHVVCLLVLVGVCFFVSDTSPIGADRPLVVSLDEDGRTGEAVNPKSTRSETSSPRMESVPPVSVPTDGSATDEHADRVAAGDRVGGPGTGGGDNAGNSGLLSDYIESVHARINRYKRYPPAAARDGIEGTVTVSFLLDKRGTLLEKDIVAGSGNRALDDAALAALGASSPFPPFPEGLHRETLRLRLPINYTHR